MESTTPIPGRFLYAAWNIDLRQLGPVVLPSRQRRQALEQLRLTADRLRSISGIGQVRLLETTFIVPVRNRPRADVVLLADGAPVAIQQVRDVLQRGGVAPPANVISGRNTERFGDTDGHHKGPILLNHFVSAAPAPDVARVWADISRWYGSALRVDNSTLLTFDSPAPYAVLNYARVPGPVVRFMLDQLLRPSFRSQVLKPLGRVGARALPLFARQVR